MQVSVRCARGRAGASGFGDFYDVLPLPAGRWGIAVGDVRPDPAVDRRTCTGNITVARAVLRATTLIESRPRLVLAALNRALLAWPAQERRSVTAIYATVRPSRLGVRMRLCIAGSQTAYLRRNDGEVSVLARSGSPLGVRADPRLHDFRLLLRPGDSLILVTDSVTAALDGDGRSLSGSVSLPQLLAGLDGASAARCADVIIRAVTEVRGKRPDDEIVALVLKVPRRRRGSGTHSAGWPGSRRYPALSLPPAEQASLRQAG